MNHKKIKTDFNKRQENSLQWHLLGGNNINGVGANSGLCLYNYFDDKGRPQKKALLFDMGIMPGDRRKPEDISLKDCDIIMPDYDSFFYKINDTKHRPETPVDSIFLTHNHSDHIGALPLLVLMGYKLPKIYATPYTAKRLEQAFSNAGLEPSEWPHIYYIAPGKAIKEGPVNVTSFWVSHSTPQSVGFFIETPEGNILNPGDFKLDQSVAWGPAFSESQFKRIVSKPVDCLLLDSTGAGKNVNPVTEKDLRDSIRGLMKENPDKRFIIAVMSGYEENLASIAIVTPEYKRKLWLAGGSHEQIVSALKATGMSFSEHLNPDIDLRILNSHKSGDALSNCKPKDSIVVVTGAQGHNGAALTRAADGNHNYLKLDNKTDIVLFCAPSLPGQEALRGRIISKLKRTGFTVITKDDLKIYPHSHARQSEVIDFIKLANPKNILPIHGSNKLREDCGDISKKLGKRILQAGNGDIINISKRGIKSAEPKTKNAPSLLGLKTLQGSSWKDRYYLVTKTKNVKKNNEGETANNNNKNPRPRIFNINGKKDF